MYHITGKADAAVALVTRFNRDDEPKGAVSGERTLEVLLLQKAKDGTWGLPGGHVESTDRSGKDAVCRELVEELGEDFRHYCGPMSYTDTVACTRGIIDVFITHVVVVDVGDPPITLSSEHSQYRWFPVHPVKATNGDVLRDIRLTGNLVRGLVASLRHSQRGVVLATRH